MKSIPFDLYRGRSVDCEAYEIQPGDMIAGNLDAIDKRHEIYNQYGEHLEFTATKPVVAGDYIIRFDDNDIYHCPREVFIAKYKRPALSKLQPTRTKSYLWSVVRQPTRLLLSLAGNIAAALYVFAHWGTL